MTTLLSFIILLGILVTIHELGHFIAARSVGVYVEKFSIGMPPRIFTITSKDNGFLFRLFFYKRREGSFEWQPIYEKLIKKNNRIGTNTEYVVALLPLGGYVKMAGMLDESMDSTLRNKDDEFMSKPLWAKIWILIAGVLMNTLLAIFIFSSIAFFQGVPEYSKEPIVSKVQEEMPAMNTGILAGDKIIRIDEREIVSWKDMTSVIHASPEKELNIKIDRNGDIQDFKVTTTYTLIPNKGKIDTIGIIGISPQFFYEKSTLLESLSIGLDRTLSSFNLIISSIGMLFSGSASVSDLGGPIMIAQLAGQTAEAGFIPFFTFMALLSVNLAFLNILPIPGLDGGHIFLHLIEGVIRRPLTIKTRIVIQQIGMAFLLMLMFTVIFSDITRLFN
jgi:regulator of sigma E protease